MKKVVIGEELDIIIKKSLDILCDTVGSTLGPKGNNSIISSSSLPAFVTDDGVTLARNIESDDVCINSVLEILKEASIPKLLLYAKPGAAISEKMVKYAVKTIKNLETEFIGRGKHFIPFDQPENIAEAINKFGVKINK
jgi:pimeloyl-ACP methyl ester carboxylesterase